MKKLFLMALLMLIVSMASAEKKQDSKTLTADTIYVAADTLEASTVADLTDYTEDIDSDHTVTNELMSEIGDNLVALTGIVFVFGSPALIVFIVFIFQHKKRKAQYEVLAKAIEAGKDIPEGFFQENQKGIKNSLTSGITNTFAGIGVSILLWALVSLKFASIGVLISCIGIGQIIIYYTMNKREKGQTDKETGKNESFAEESKHLPE